MQNRTVGIVSVSLFLVAGAAGWWVGRSTSSVIAPASNPDSTIPESGLTQPISAAPSPPNHVKLPPPPTDKVVHGGKLPGPNTEDGIRVLFDGQRYPTPLVITPVEQPVWDKSTPEASYAGIYSANRTGSTEWMLATFDTTSRATVKAAMTAEALANNAKIFAMIVEEKLVERIEYGDYVILINVSTLENGQTVPSINPMKKTAEGWLLTNDLENDPILPLLLVLATEQYRKK